MRSFREFMMRALAGMQGRKRQRQRIRFGIWAEGDDSSARSLIYRLIYNFKTNPLIDE
nr:MAG TPA: hypothetical protein [Caudoviricetes sp.]